MRLPWSLPCMSVRHSSTVSIRPASTSARRSSSVMWGEGICNAPLTANRRPHQGRRHGRSMGPPRAVIEAVQDQLGPLAEEPVVLGGGITNHNFRARFGDAEVVLRLAGRDTGLLGIDRGAEHIATEAAARLGIAPPVLAFLPEHACL